MFYSAVHVKISAESEYLKSSHFRKCFSMLVRGPDCMILVAQANWGLKSRDTVLLRVFRGFCVLPPPPPICPEIELLQDYTVHTGNLGRCYTKTCQAACLVRKSENQRDPEHLTRIRKCTNTWEGGGVIFMYFQANLYGYVKQI